MSQDTGTAPPDCVRDVLARYLHFRSARDLDSTVRPLHAGFSATTWLIATSDERLLLRQLPSNTETERASFTAAIHDHAARAGMAPPIMPDVAGDLVTSHAGRLFQLIRYVEGDRVPRSTPARAACHNLGHTLGRLHQVLRAAQAPATAPHQALPDDPTTSIRAALDCHDNAACSHATARQALTVKLRYAKALDPDLLAEVARLPTQVIHGDFHPSNIICPRARPDDHQAYLVIDFDLARVAPPGYELMRALIYCVRPAGPPAVFGPQIAEFLDGYLTARPLSEHEIETMVELYKMVQILDIHGLNTCRDASQPILRFGQARFALLYWIRRHEEHLRALAHQAFLRLNQEERKS